MDKEHFKAKINEKIKQYYKTQLSFCIETKRDHTNLPHVKNKMCRHLDKIDDFLLPLNLKIQLVEVKKTRSICKIKNCEYFICGKCESEEYVNIFGRKVCAKEPGAIKKSEYSKLKKK